MEENINVYVLHLNENLEKCKKIKIKIIKIMLKGRK